MDLQQYGGISSAGEDLTVSAGNSAALVSAIDRISGGRNSPANTSGKSGLVTLGGLQWTFDKVDLQDKWGWSLDCANATMYMNGIFDVSGCAFFELNIGFMKPVAAKTNLINGLILDISTVDSERTHNFKISFKFMGEFLDAFYCDNSWSQGTITGGQFNGNIRSFASLGGGENVVLKDFIFAGHVTNTSEIVFFQGSNAICDNWQLETLPDNDRADIRIAGAAGISFPNLVMNKSGGIRVEGGIGSITEGYISNSRATNVINHVGGVEWEVVGNRIAWDLNNGTGDAFTDGTGKTGIKTAVGLRQCSGNTIKRGDSSIHTTASTLQSYLGNMITDSKTTAFLLAGADNVSIQGGAISLDQAGEKGITVTGTNGSNNKFSNIAWSGATADRYNLSTGNGQGSIIIDSGIGDPESLGIIAGSGSTFNVVGAGAGSSLYVKSLFGTGANEWEPVGAIPRTGAQIIDEADFVNVTGKHQRRQCYNTTTNELLIASGSGANDAWKDAQGVTVITPAP
jgi:hypothetical protein